jgi:putative transferase (TIGR04331 family)
MSKFIDGDVHLHLTLLKVPACVKNGSTILTINSFIEKLENTSKGRMFVFVAIESPWLERLRVHVDYKQVRGIYNANLPILIMYLKKIHVRRTYENNFWKTLVSPWLIIMSMNFFNKQKIVDSALKFENIGSYSVLPDSEAHLKFYNDEEYSENLRFNENWNFAQYTIILKSMYKLNFVNPINCMPEQYDIKKKKQTKLYSRLVHGVSFFMAKYIYTGVLFYGAYFDKISLLKLQFSLKQLPLFFSKLITISDKDISIDRGSFKYIDVEGSPNNAAFSDILKYTLPVYLVEEFDVYIKNVSNFKLLLKPVAIVTATSLWFDTGFKFYVAYVRRFSDVIPVMLIQHGGAVGILKSDIVDYEQSFADYYLTWGFVAKNISSNHIRFGNPKKSSSILRKRDSNSGSIVLVRSWYPRHVQFLFSEIDTDEAYLNDSINFVTNLSPKILDDHLLLRLYPEKRAYNNSIDIGNNEKEYWQDNFSNVEIDQYSDTYKLYSESSLVIYTYLQGTGYVECLANNIPVIIISRYCDEIIKDEFKSISNKLKKCNILFDNPEVAAQHVNNIFNNVNEWWLEANVQDAVKDFNDIYTYKPDDRIKSFKETLNSNIKKE